MRAWGFEGSGVGLGRWLGVEVRLDWSLLLIFGLIVLHLGLSAWPSVHPEWSVGLRWGMAAFAAVLFLLTVLLHELSHAVVARWLGVDVRGIVLFLFGGMSMMRTGPGARPTSC